MHPVTDAEVAKGEDIWPNEAEHHEHVRTPRTNPADSDKARPHILVAHVVDSVKAQFSRVNLRRQINDRQRLGPGEPDATQGLMVCGQQIGGLGVVTIWP